MNPFVKSVSHFISGLNHLIDGMGRRTADTVRQAFFTLTALLLVAGAFIGYSMGQKSAKKAGTRLVESTNDAFRIDIKQERRGGDFRSMLDTELINEIRESRINKVEFPSAEKFEPQRGEGIIEPDTSERKITPGPALDLRDRISEADRMDERPAAADVRNLKRRDLDSSYPERPGLIKDEPEERIMKPAGEGPARLREKTGESEKPARIESRKIIRKAPELKPIEKKTGIIEK